MGKPLFSEGFLEMNMRYMKSQSVRSSPFPGISSKGKRHYELITMNTLQ